VIGIRDYVETMVIEATPKESVKKKKKTTPSLNSQKTNQSQNHDHHDKDDDVTEGEDDNVFAVPNMLGKQSTKKQRIEGPKEMMVDPHS